MNLLSEDKNIYGLVFASYVSKEKKEKEREDFYQKDVLDKASGSFKNHNSNKLDFDHISEDVEVKVLELLILQP